MFSKANIALAVSIVAIVVAGWGLVGDNQSDQLGATRFPSGLNAGSIVVDGTKDLDNGSATSTFDFGKACVTIIDEAGTSGFLRYTATGFATTSTSCN